MPGISSFWLKKCADAVEEYVARKKGSGSEIVCAAGMTPSCPIHAGILREIFISYFLSQELKSRGHRVKLIYYWDDYDHFIKIPFYASRGDVEDYLGMPLSDMPDIKFNTYKSYAYRHILKFEDCLQILGINPVYNYQSELYKSGVFLKYIIKAVEKRFEIFDILHLQHKPYSVDMENRKKAFYPVQIYCSKCCKDSTRTESYSSESAVLRYICDKCGHNGSYNLNKYFFGKLIWKVNWAMRWFHDSVDFEASGENHLTKLGSYSASSKMVSSVFGGTPPYSQLYRFVGASGIAKLSRTQGEKSLARRYTDLIEPVVLRWLFIKKRPEKPFLIDIDNGLNKIYHEWDVFLEKVQSGDVDEVEKNIFEYSTADMDYCSIPVAFRTLTTAISVAGGDTNISLKIISKYIDTNENPGELKEKLEPRFSCALKWNMKYRHSEEALTIRGNFNSEYYETLNKHDRKAIAYIVENLEHGWTEERLMNIFYEAPLLARNLNHGFVSKEEIKLMQKGLFEVLYSLITDRKRGPKLSTIFMMISREHILSLLQPETGK